MIIHWRRRRPTRFTFEQCLDLLVLWIKGVPPHRFIHRAQQLLSKAPRRSSHNPGPQFPSSREKRYERKQKLRRLDAFERWLGERELAQIEVEHEEALLEAEEQVYDDAMYQEWLDEQTRYDYEALWCDDEDWAIDFPY